MINNRENNIWTVYVHIVPKTITEYDYDKYYVGITSKSVEKRWEKNGRGYYNQPFYNAIKKYGWDNIEHYIVAEHLTELEAQKLEESLIKVLDCNINKGKYGYNCSDGGKTSKGYKHLNETKIKISKSKLGKKMINSSQCVETYQFDLEGNYINKYYSIREATKDCNLRMGNIYRCLKNQQHSHGGYIWCEKKDVKIIDGIYKPINLPPKYKINRAVYQFDLKGNFIKSYNKLSDTLSFNKKYKKDNISQCLLHINKTSYGYIWKYEEEIDIINGIPKLKNINLQRKKPERHKYDKHVYQFDINGNFIEEYLTCQHASRELKIDNSSIAKCAKKLKNTAGGYIWRYKEYINFDKNGKPILLEGDNYE